MPVVVPAPPACATPQIFYGDYAPQAWKAFWTGAEAPASLGLDVDLIIGPTVLGVMLRAAELSIMAGALASPLFRVRCDPEAWRTTTLDVWPRALKTLSPRLEELRASFLAFASDRDLGALVRDLLKLPGCLRLDYVDDAGDTSSFEVSIGSGQGPRAHVIARETDLWPLFRGEVTLSKLLRSRFKMTGDTGYVLRLVATFANGG